MTTSIKMKKEPIAVFGVLTDVQYADADDRISTCSSKTRYYRGSLQHVDEAFNFWENHKMSVKFVLQLGDIIDNLNRVNNKSHEGLSLALTHFEQHATIPTFHTVGNHELYNFNRKELALLFYQSVMKVKIPPEIFNSVKSSDSIFPQLYYRFSPVVGLKCISLDCFDISVLGYPSEHPKYLQAAEMLRNKHGHDVFEDWDCDGPLEGLDVRFQQMNGAVSQEQLLWLDKELKESDDLGQKVIVYGHVSLHPDSSEWSCLLWNYEEVMSVFHRHRCVVAYLSGHTHESGYAADSHGISYVSFAAALESPPGQAAFATVAVYADRLRVEGRGRQKSYDVPLGRGLGPAQRRES